MAKKSVKKDIKVGLCCIAKMENNYIREFIEHYKNLGVDHVFLYDNNDTDGENFEDVIGDYIENGYIEVIDFKNRKICQLDAYNDCYKNRCNGYDWVCFFDCDEFLDLRNDKSLKKYLSKKCFDDFEQIHINWKVFSDNGLIHYENKPLKERFTEPAPFDAKNQYSFPENYHIKTIIRTNTDKTCFFENPHYLSNNERETKVCDCDGNKAANGAFIVFNENGSAFLNHYQFKTLEEFVFNRVVKGACDCGEEHIRKRTRICNFFKINERTEEKRKFLIENNIPYPYKVGIVIPTKGKVYFLTKLLYSIIYHSKYDTDLLKFYIADTGSEQSDKNEIIKILNRIKTENGIDSMLIEYGFYNFAKINNHVVNNYVDKDTDIVLFCNNDIELVNDAITKCVNTVDKYYDSIGTVGARLMYYNNTIQHCGVIFKCDDNITGVGHVLQDKIWTISQKENEDDIIIDSFGNTAAFMMVKYKDFISYGGFPEKYEKCFEDAELNLDMFLDGRKNYTNASAVCWHFESLSRGKSMSENDKNVLFSKILENRNKINDFKIKIVPKK